MTTLSFLYLLECAMEAWNLAEEEGSGDNETCSDSAWNRNSTREEDYDPEFSAIVGPHVVCNDLFCGLRALSFVGPKKDGRWP